MTVIKSISNAFADIVLMDGRELHVAAKPSALDLLSALAKKAPVETFFDIRTGASKAASDSREREAIFRLGQMDMQASVCDMLEATGKQYEDATSYSYAFLKAAGMVRAMEVSNANS